MATPLRAAGGGRFQNSTQTSSVSSSLKHSPTVRKLFTAYLADLCPLPCQHFHSPGRQTLPSESLQDRRPPRVNSGEGEGGER